MTARNVFVAGLAAWIAVTALQWARPAPLGHDEAQYALAARDVLAGVEPRWIYLSTGMNAVSIPGIWLGESERALRFLPLLIGIAYVLVTAGLARRAIGGITAAFTVAVLAGTRPLLQESSQLLSDLPSAACLIAAMWLIASELPREDGPRWRVVGVAPLLAAGFYVRYGNCVPITIIVVVALALWWRSILRRPLPVLATAVLFVALLIPHALNALHTTGGVFGILLESKDVPGASMGDGLIDYVSSNPIKYYGLLGPLVIVMGLAVFTVARDRMTVFLWLVGIGDIVGMGLTTHAQPRYILLGTTLLAMLGVETLRRLIERRPERVRASLGIAAVAVIAVTWIIVTRQAIQYSERTRSKLAGFMSAIDVARRDAGGTPCTIITRHSTQVEWYAGCRGTFYPPLEAIDRREAVYALRDDTGGDQPDLPAMPGRHRVLLDTSAIQLIRLDKQ